MSASFASATAFPSADRGNLAKRHRRANRSALIQPSLEKLKGANPGSEYRNTVISGLAKDNGTLQSLATASTDALARMVAICKFRSMVHEEGFVPETSDASVDELVKVYHSSVPGSTGRNSIPAAGDTADLRDYVQGLQPVPNGSTTNTVSRLRLLSDLYPAAIFKDTDSATAQGTNRAKYKLSHVGIANLNKDLPGGKLLRTYNDRYNTRVKATKSLTQVDKFLNRADPSHQAALKIIDKVAEFEEETMNSLALSWATKSQQVDFQSFMFGPKVRPAIPGKIAEPSDAMEGVDPHGAREEAKRQYADTLTFLKGFDPWLADTSNPNLTFGDENPPRRESFGGSFPFTKMMSYQKSLEYQRFAQTEHQRQVKKQPVA